MSRKHCLDNPSLPHKEYRNVLAKRLRADAAALKAKLTPILVEAFDEYQAEGAGHKLGSDAARILRTNLGDSLEAALDGSLDLTALPCPTCALAVKEEARAKAAAEDGTVHPPGPSLAAASCRKLPQAVSIS
jgi:hypothetical protein